MGEVSIRKRIEKPKSHALLPIINFPIGNSLLAEGLLVYNLVSISAPLGVIRIVCSY